MKKALSLLFALALTVCLLAGVCLSVSATEATGTPIEKVELTMESVELGKALPEIVAPAGAKYTVMTWWADENSGSDFLGAGTVATKNGSYTLNGMIYAADGYIFTEETDVSFNGVSTRESEEMITEFINEGEIVILSFITYNFGDPISEVRVTFTEPVAGQPLSMPVAEGDNYSVDAGSTGWYDYAQKVFLTPGETARDDNSYYLDLWVKPNAGYKFTDDTLLYVNGVEQIPVWGNGGRIAWGSEIFSFCDPVAEVRLNYAEPVLGEKLPVPTVSGTDVLLDYWCWQDYDTGEAVAEDAVAEKGHRYELWCYIMAADGLLFDEHTEFYVNGQLRSLDGNLSSNGQSIEFCSETYDFGEKITAVSFTFADAVVGKTFPKAVAPADANYEVVTEWYDCLTDEYVTGKVQAGGIYDAYVYVLPLEGYGFGKEVTLTVNGKEASSDEYYFWATQLEYTKHVSFAKGVAKVNLPAVPTLKLGDKLPSASGKGTGYTYTLETVGMDANGNRLTGTTVVNGGFYMVNLTATVAAGYEFNDETVFTVGGKTPDGFTNYSYAAFRMYKVFDFGAIDLTHKIQLDLQIPAIGQTGGEVTVDENAAYVLEDIDWGVSPDGTMANATEATGPYQAGDHPMLVAVLYTKGESLFSQDLTVVIGGKEYTPVLIQGALDYVIVVLDLGEVTAPKHNGLVAVDGVWGYYKDGVLQEDYTGLVPYGDILFYVENGILDFSYTGLVWYNDAWTYVANSELTEGYTGLVWFNENWFYTVDSVIDWTFTGLVPYEGNYFYVQNNLLDWSYTSLGYHDGSWYFIQNGLLQKEYSGLVYFNDNWFYVEEGELTYKYFGMVEYEGNMFYVQASYLDWNYTGLGFHEGNWYYFLNALYMPEFNGLVPFNGSSFYVEDGILTWTTNGLREYGGKLYYIVNSEFDDTFNGKVEYDGVEYEVVNGIAEL